MTEEGQELNVYMVDRDLPGVTLEQLDRLQKAAIDMSRQFTAAGRPVRYIRGMYVPGESRVMCLFEASESGLVEEVNHAAGIPYTRVVRAIDLEP
jgi:hypothetical protein